VAFGYVVQLFFLYGPVLSAVDTNGCIREHTCSDRMRIVADGTTLAWFAIVLATIVATWKGLLFGARRDRRSDSDPPVV
jgi:hypothetical protein